MTESAPPGGAKTSKAKRRFSVDALFTDTRPQAAGVSDLTNAKEIALTRIEPDPDQPRRTFDEARLEELTASIQIEGILQPIVVRYHQERDLYIIIHGERRWRAANAAGLAAIPALVRDVPEERRLVQQLMENIVRDDLNPVDRAAALRTLKRQLGDASWETVAETVGIKRSRLFQLLDTEKLPEPIQDDIRAGRLSEKQSRVLQGLAPVFQTVLRDELVERQLPQVEAVAIARHLRAIEAPQDEQRARIMFADARIELANNADSSAAPSTPTSHTISREDALAALTALMNVARGDAQSVSDLAAFVTTRRVPPRAYRKLDAESLALAGILARLHTAPQHERESARPLLESLRDTLDAMLGEL
jgi:ParB family transcriptional regulator, chromosome partitioning protein